MKLPLLMLLLLLAVSFCGRPSVASDKQRAKRASLLYPRPSFLLLIFGLGTPLQLDRESVIVGAFAKLMYNLPTNSSAYDPPGSGNATSSRSRWSLYGSLDRFLERLDFGRGCVLRAVCEVASAPFDDEGPLLHQLLQTFLTPSASVELEEDEDGYEEAERQGRMQRIDGDECHALYPECRKSLLDVFSRSRPHDYADPM